MAKDKILPTETGVSGAAKTAASAGQIASVAGANQNLGSAIATDEQLGSLLNMLKGVTKTDATTQAVADSYTDKRKKQAYEHYDKNLAKNNPLGNLNDKSGAQTLHQSRLADALNNRRWWQPTGATARSVKLGAQQADMNNTRRFEPIETQDMRQMRANESIDQAVRQAQAGLQAGVNQHALNLRQTADQNTMGVAGAYGMINPAMQQQYRQANEQLNYTMPGQMAYGTFTQAFGEYLAQYVGYDQANEMMRLTQLSPTMATVVESKLNILTPQLDPILQETTFQEAIAAEEERLGRKLTAKEEKKLKDMTEVSYAYMQKAKDEAVQGKGGITGGGLPSIANEMEASAQKRLAKRNMDER